MTIIERFTSEFISKYHAVPIAPGVAAGYLEEGEELISALSFNDPAINYTLLTQRDLASLGDELALETLKTKRSPFKELVLVFFRKDGEIDSRLIGGMASKLILRMWEIEKEEV